VFPRDWSLAYRAGYHYLYEEKDNIKAANMLKIAAMNGAPGWVSQLSARLYADEGQIELGLKTLYEARTLHKESRWSSTIENKIKVLEERKKN